MVNGWGTMAQCNVIHRHELDCYFIKLNEKYSNETIIINNEDRDKICELLLTADLKYFQMHLGKFRVQV